MSNIDIRCIYTPDQITHIDADLYYQIYAAYLLEVKLNEHVREQDPNMMTMEILTGCQETKYAHWLKLNMNEMDIYLAYDGEKAIGVSMSKARDNVYYIRTVYFEEEYRGNGYLDQFIAEWKKRAIATKCTHLVIGGSVFNIQGDKNICDFYMSKGWTPFGCHYAMISSVSYIDHSPIHIGKWVARDKDSSFINFSIARNYELLQARENLHPNLARYIDNDVNDVSHPQVSPIWDGKNKIGMIQIIPSVNSKHVYLLNMLHIDVFHLDDVHPAIGLHAIRTYTERDHKGPMQLIFSSMVDLADVNLNKAYRNLGLEVSDISLYLEV